MYDDVVEILFRSHYVPVERPPGQILRDFRKPYPSCRHYWSPKPFDSLSQSWNILTVAEISNGQFVVKETMRSLSDVGFSCVAFG